MTGLARAFFYAGARSLLVSHFPIQDDAAAKITGRTFEVTLGRNLEFGAPECQQISGGTKSSALRRSMCELLYDRSRDDEPITFAHPSAWAAFSLIDSEIER